MEENMEFAEADSLSEKKERRLEIQKMLLFGVAGAGLLASALVAPNVIGAIGKLYVMTKDEERGYRSYAKTAIGRLKKKGFVETVHENGKIFYRLTEAGERQLLKYRLKENALKKKRWDGKWRLVIFDIQETRRYARDRWRDEIASFGFIRLQDSVWVSPYESEELVSLLKTEFHVGRDVLYIVADSIENDRELKDRFGIES
ncbi:MAG: CRISPR-associated endonuclease Cas2 [Candidatus Moranbacteria bacterium]|nr:CRISPR-associated endonuclease Cas2 [Candidatus Moranbacteria bacterium]